MDEVDRTPVTIKLRNGTCHLYCTPCAKALKEKLPLIIMSEGPNYTDEPKQCSECGKTLSITLTQQGQHYLVQLIRGAVRELLNYPVMHGRILFDHTSGFYAGKDGFADIVDMVETYSDAALKWDNKNFLAFTVAITGFNALYNTVRMLETKP